VGRVPPGWCKQGRRQRRGRFGAVPAGWEGFLQDGANRGVDSAEEDVEVYLQGVRGSSRMVQAGA
jgi:hypothetical protein